MAVPQRIRMSPLDFDHDPDEELPEYEESDAPAYDDDEYDAPFITYGLRQYDRRIQVLASRGANSVNSYRFTTNGFRLFSKKPEIEVLYTSPEMRQRIVATIAFQADGPLPWRPRAYFCHNALDGLDTRYAMESRNFSDWTFEIGGKMYIWRLTMHPVSYVLAEIMSNVPIARFTYSAMGALAGNGAEIGELVIYRDCLTTNQNGMDSLVCGLMVAMTFMKKQGKFHRNDVAELERMDTLTRELSPLQRASLAGAPTF